MRVDVHVIGKGPVGTTLRSRLGDSPLARSRCAIVADWPDIRALRRRTSELRTPWILVEDAGNGDVAIGPVFRPRYRGCFDCYLARRCANGGRECRPAAAIDEHVLEFLEHAIENIFSKSRDSASIRLS